MLIEPVPIQSYVPEKMRTPAFQRIVDSWNVDPQRIAEILINFFRDMGIYRVSHVNEIIVLQTMRRGLRTLPEIQSLVKQKRREEALRRTRQF